MLSRSRHVLLSLAAIGAIGGFALVSLAQDDAPSSSGQANRAAGSGWIAIPEPIRVEHEHLHHNLQEAMRAGGETGSAAKRVQQALADHFEQENELVMPLLGLLGPLAEGEASEQMRPAIAMSEKVQELLPQFMEEHRAIHEAVDQLEKVAESEGKSEVAGFARRLRLHARHEEAVLYPAAIVVGQRVKDLLGDAPRRSR